MPNIQTQGMQMPVASKSAAQQVQSTNDIALQQQMKAAGANTPVTSGDIQNLGTQQAAQQTALGQAEQQASLGDTINAAQRDFQTQQNAAAEQGIMDDQARAQARIDMEEQLASLGSDVRETLLDRELALDKNTNQLKFTNERQLADLAAKIATDERDLQGRIQDMQQASDTALAAAQYAAQQMSEAAMYASKDRQISQDEEMMKMIRQRQQEANERLKAAKKKAAKTQKMIGAVKMGAGAAMLMTPGLQGAGAGLATSGATDVASTY